MEQVRTLAIATLRTLIGLHHMEEKRLRAILVDEPSAKIRTLTQCDLENLLKRIKYDEVEPARRHAEK
jgi:hypothetical protein